jgi:hypothetical protein
MKTLKNTLYFVLCTFVLVLTSCEPKELTENDVFAPTDEASLAEMLKAENPDGQYKIYNINSLISEPFMTEQGNFKSDSSLYRTRSSYKGLELFSIDTLPVNGPGIYIRGRVATDDYGGNFYKSLVIQQVNDWENGGASIDQQCLRISVDMGSANGQYPQGQEILIRCNGLAIGRYANEPQLCVPSYNNNIFASSYSEKTGWAPGRIPSGIFRRVARLIGMPDKSKLVYETMTLTEMNTKYLSKYNDVVGARTLDGRLVKITEVHFSGEYDDLQKGVTPCNRYTADTTNNGNPELDGNACTFGPTTGNVGYPQSRYVKDAAGANKLLISTSEYARYAYFYLPAPKYVGSVTGILGYYMDNGKYDPDGGEWSITPCNIGDILPECQKEDADPRWTPTEWKLGTPQPED